MPPERHDPAEHVAATLKWLHPGNEVFEIRMLNPVLAAAPQCWEGRAYGGKDGKPTVSGWFRDQAKAVELISKVVKLKGGGKMGAEGIYVTLNPCREELLARVHERLKANQKPTTADPDIVCRRNLLLDFDPKRPAGISSTDHEHETALLFARHVKAELTQAGWPAPLVADSGNGAHLIYAIDLDNTPESLDLLKAVLGALAQRYAVPLADGGLDLDQTVFNAARISKLYGTPTGKGDHTPERPHRWAKIIELPEVRSPVSLGLLQDLAASFSPQASGGSGGNLRHSGEEKREERVDLAAYLEHYGVEIVRVKEHGSSQLYCLAQCLFDPSHTGNEAAIGQAADGKLFYQCFHNSCKGREWAEARQLISHGDKLGQFMVGGSPRSAQGRRGLRGVGSGQAEKSVCKNSQTEKTGKPDGNEPPREPVTEGLSWSNLGNARRLVELHGRDLRYNHLHKKWYVWTGSAWAEDQRGEIVRRAKHTVESIYDEAKNLEWESDNRKKLLKFALRSESSGEIAGMLKLAQSEPGIPVLPDEFDADPWLFNAANGTIDLRTGLLQEHRREDLLTCLSPVPFDPKAQYPEFEKFMYQIMNNNNALVEFLWMSLGYALSGDCREQCFWIFWGSGANGKGTLMNLISEIFGSYWTNISTETILAKDSNGNQIRSDLAQLDGPRLVTASEIDKGRRLSESLVKSLSGQDPITARKLYGDEFTFTPQFKMFVQSNNKPIIRDLTEGMWRRLKLVKFPMKFEKKKDTELPEKLRAERSGILGWLVKGCLEWQRFGGLDEPEEVSAAVQDYRDQMDPLKEWMDEKCLIAPDLTATAGDLYGSYSDWAEHNLQKRERLTKRAFGLALGEKSFENGKGTGGVRLWRGLGLRTFD